MAVWDDMKDNITKAFRYVPLVDSAVDVYDLLSGKTPDQIADTKVKNMDDGITEFGVSSGKGMGGGMFSPIVDQDADQDADALLDDDGGFFDNLGDTIGNMASQFNVKADELTDNIMNAILDQFDEQTLSEEFGSMDPTMLTPDILAQMAAEDEAKQQAKESGEFWRDTPVGGVVETLEDINRGIPGAIRGIGGVIKQGYLGIGSELSPVILPPRSPWPDVPEIDIMGHTVNMPDQYPIKESDELTGLYQAKIDQLHTLLDPNDPASAGEITEDLARMAAEGILKPGHIRAWIESPQFGRGLDTEDVQRMYGTLDSLVDQITPLLDHFDALSISHRLPPSSYKALTSTNIMIDSPIVKQYKDALQVGAPPGAVNKPLDSTLDIGGDPTTGIQTGIQTGISPQEQIVEDQTVNTTTGLQWPAGVTPPKDQGDLLMEQLSADTMLETTLSEIFYTTVSQMKDAGRPEVRSLLPELFKTTSLLFDLYNPGVNQNYYEDQESTGKKYKAFLNDFLQPGGRAKYMSQLSDSVETLNTYLARGQQGDIFGDDHVSELDKWANAIMNKPGSLNRLAKLHNTGGQTGSNASHIHAYLDELTGYFTNMGMSEADIFRKLTTQPIASNIVDSVKSQQVPPGEDNKARTLTSKVMAHPIIQEDDLFRMPEGEPDLTTGENDYGDMFTTIGTGRSDETILGDAVSTGLAQRTAAEGRHPSDMRELAEHAVAGGITSSQIESMPTAFNPAEHAKKMKGLPYVTLRVANGKRAKGTTFVPTKGYQADKGSVIQKQQQQSLLSKV